MIKIDKKIVGYSVAEDKQEPPNKLKRPIVLVGKTVKLKTPDFNIYLTVNCQDDGKPFEMFFSSSHLESQQWVAGITRLVSAMLRSNDNKLNSLEFIAKELIKVEDQRGFYGKVIGDKKPKYQNGIVQYIGRTLLALSKHESEGQNEMPETVPCEQANNPCPECGEEMKMMDGCYTCPTCGYSKCG